MNYINGALQLYISIGIILMASYILFWALRKFTQLETVKVSHRQRLRLGQLVVVLSLLAPIAVILSPINPMGKFNLWEQAKTTSVKPPKPMNEGAPLVTRIQKNAYNPVERATVFAGPAQQASTGFSFGLFHLVLAAFLMGLAFVAYRFVKDIKALRKLISQGLATRKLGNVSVYVSEEASIPFSTLANGRASVVLPFEMLGLRKDQRIALEHELQHHRQRDTSWVLFMEVLKLAYYWNPAIYLWSTLIGELQEHACDEALLARRKCNAHDYGHCLLRVAERAALDMNRLPAIAGMASYSDQEGGKRSLLQRRINMMTSFKGLVEGNRYVVFLLAVAITGMVGVIAFASTEPRTAKIKDFKVHPQVQKIVEDVLTEGVNNAKAKSGFAVVEDPHTGKVLAVAYYNRVKGERAAKPIKDSFLAKSYEPWSLVKPIYAAIAIDKKKTTKDELHDCGQGKLKVGDQVHYDYKKHGNLTTEQMVIQSSNTCAIKVAQKVGERELVKSVRAMGFGPSGVAGFFPGAAPGKLETRKVDQHWVGNMAGGYITHQTTPLEIVQVYSAIANGGKLMRPTTMGSDQIKSVRRIFNPDTAKTMRSILAKVVQEGTGRNAQSAIYTTAGKTATGIAKSHWGKKDKRGQGTASFIGFAPAKRPRAVVYVRINQPQGNAHGGKHAAPVFRKIVDQTLKTFGVAPDRTRASL